MKAKGSGPNAPPRVSKDAKILVAGATGVLGRRVVPQLVARGHLVDAVARGPQRAEVLRRQGATPVTVDLFDPAAVTAAVAGHDVVLNLATAIPATSRMLWPPSWEATNRLRTEGARNLVSAALATGAARYVQESLAFVYGDHGADWITEDAPLAVPRMIRAVQQAEAQALRFGEGRGTGVILRFGLFYAADTGHTRDLLRVARRGLLPIPGRRDGYQPWIHVDDAAAAVVAAVDAPEGVYNVVEDHSLTNAEHAELLGALLGRRVVRLPAALGTVGVLALQARSQRVANRRLREATGWRAIYPSRREGWTQVLAALDGTGQREATHA